MEKAWSSLRDRRAILEHSSMVDLPLLRPVPQARVIHSSSPEWGSVSAGVEAAQAEWRGGGETVEEKVCEEVLEALRLSRCLLFMG